MYLGCKTMVSCPFSLKPTLAVLSRSSGGRLAAGKQLKSQLHKKKPTGGGSGAGEEWPGSEKGTAKQGNTNKIYKGLEAMMKIH